jgi:acyl carrier protein
MATMEQPTWSDRYDEVLRQHLPLLGDTPLEPGTKLADAGLDSLGTVALLVELEEALAVVVPDDRLGAGTFETAGSLWDVLADLGGDRD